MRNHQAIIASAAILLSACGTGELKTDLKEKKQMVSDVHSFSRPEEAVMKHLSLDLTVDFDTKMLSGMAILDIENKQGVDSIVLDVRDLKINKITIDGDETSYRIGASKPYMGNPLAISIKPGTKKVAISYSTSPNAAALQWLEPGQTAGGKSPFLFTQSQAVLARTWIPLQDSPGIKFTYDAQITVP
ncbi:MAG: aminopeptidase, partial [Bacteroidota bacterium]